MPVKKYEYTTVVTSSQDVNTGIDDYLINASSGNINVTLPSASETGLKSKVFTFRRIDSTANVVNILASGSDNIYGRSSISLSTAQTVRLIIFTGTTWYNIMDNAKIYTTVVLSSATPTIDVTYDVIQLDTSGNTVAAVLPAANTVPVGTKVVVVTTSASNAGTVAPAAGNTINGGSGAIATVVNVGKTFFTTSSTAWRQF